MWVRWKTMGLRGGEWNMREEGEVEEDEGEVIW